MPRKPETFSSYWKLRPGVFEIESSELALQKGNDATKTFAQQMVADPEKTAELKALIAVGKVMR
ncbi:DUF4142 domain-containing protein [Rhizobium sp.]|uniref:DUF4142 domain-containing protein n=1 Tax=Rhizobium sp. TaxID=391 RepID=UPI0039175E11